MPDLRGLVKLLLRPTERLGFLLEAELDERTNNPPNNQDNKPAILAVVSHFDEFDGHEEGRFVVFFYHSMQL
jgi:hypothetical protein